MVQCKQPNPGILKDHLDSSIAEYLCKRGRGLLVTFRGASSKPKPVLSAELLKPEEMQKQIKASSSPTPTFFWLFVLSAIIQHVADDLYDDGCTVSTAAMEDLANLTFFVAWNLWPPDQSLHYSKSSSVMLMVVKFPSSSKGPQLGNIT